MLIQASAPRPIFNAAESPQHVRIQTLRKPNVSEGGVNFSYVADAVNGEPSTVLLEPLLVYPIEGEEGFEVREYYLPFENAFKVTPSAEKQLVKYAAQSVAPLGIASIVTSGFTVMIWSAHQTDRTTYEERTIGFKMLFPITGGGILRMADSFIDIANPTFSPRAPIPKPHLNPDVRLAFNRTHRVLPKAEQDSIEARRRARIAEAEANVAANSRALGGKAPKELAAAQMCMARAASGALCTRLSHPTGELHTDANGVQW